MQTETSAADGVRTLSFDDLPLAPFLKETVKAIGYTTPTPIQAQAIPLICEGRDIVGLAQTGTGKTAAFVLPILQKLSGTKDKGAKALILAPTRELAEQINDVIKELAPRTGLKSVTIYGGVSHGRQISDLRGKPQIIVACPGRLLDHISGRSIDLKGIEYLVLDEADRMCDMGFLPDIKKIISKIPTERQTLLFSATMPEEIRELTNGIQNDPAVVRVKIEDANASVSHSMYQIAQTSKPHVLSHWLNQNQEALVVVFTKMKHTAKRLAEQLAKKGQDVTSLHGNLSQGKRQHALNGFKDGRYRVLIATDIAARGIDVKGITHVVNYDMPENLDAYIHRTGRAGRASATGEAISFVTKADGYLVRSIERWLKSPVARLETPNLEGVAEEMVDTDAPRTRARPGRNAQRGRPGRRERTERGPRSPRREGQGRSGPNSRGFGRGGPNRFDSRRERPDGGRQDGARPDSARRDGQRAPRYAYGPESEGRERRPQFNGGERRERGFGRPSGGGRFNDRPQRRDDRFGGRGNPSSSRGPRRGEPRDRLQGLEGPDLNQVEALKVLERRERGGDRRGGRPSRFNGEGRGRPSGGRPQRGGWQRPRSGE